MQLKFVFWLQIPALHSEKGKANFLRALFFHEKYKTNIDDVRRMRRYSRNKLQWNKSDIKSNQMTNGDYFFKILCSLKFR